jgi:adenylosuccinate lyase
VAFLSDFPFKHLLMSDEAIAAAITSDELDELLDPKNYTGLAGHFVDKVLAECRAGDPGS